MCFDVVIGPRLLTRLAVGGTAWLLIFAGLGKILVFKITDLQKKPVPSHLCPTEYL